MNAAAAAFVLGLSVTTTSRAQDSTASIRFNAVKISPVMRAAGETVWRSRNLTADIGSQYSAIPFDGTTNAKTSEFRGTGRQSLIGLLAEAKYEGDSLSAYWESDFLAAGTTSNSNENDGYPVRLRQYWALWTNEQHVSFATGQMWSLLATNKKGILPRTEQIPTTIDGQYAVGFNWARQFGARLVKTDNAVSYGVEVDAAQTTFSARNAPTDFVVGQVGGSQLNQLANYSTDMAPDLIGKIAFDPAGRGHWELKAIGRVLRDRLIDPTNVAGGSRMLSGLGGGAGFSGLYPVMHDNRNVVDIGVSGLGGKGIGRYGTSQLPDATIASDGSLQPLLAGQLLLTIEAHPTRKLDVYSYEGVEYAGRSSYVDSAGRGVGYGSPLNVNTGCETEAAPGGPYAPQAGPCNADNRAIWQANLGFWYRLRKNAAGTVQWGLQYSHTVRRTWSGVGGEPQGADNMVFSSFRYILP